MILLILSNNNINKLVFKNRGVTRNIGVGPEQVCQAHNTRPQSFKRVSL